ncbi:MAG TPA: hypothetical protein VF519_00155 [Mycobacteriales bacterium]|jgi:hypothetical protein
MTLLDDLRALDLSAITSARADISLSVNGEGVQAIVDGGAVTSALGDVGVKLAALTDAMRSPESLLEPLATELLRVGNAVDARVASLPIDDYVRAVQEGIAVVASLLDGVADDPLAMLKVGGRALPDLLGSLPDQAAATVADAVDAASGFASLVARVDGDLPRDVAGLLDLSFEVLSPFPRHLLDGLRARVDALLSATASLTLPAARTEGLVLSLDAVATAAATGDAAAVTRAIADLERVRAQTVAVIRADLSVVATAVGSLPVTALAEAVAGAHGAVTSAEVTLLDAVGGWRAHVAELRAMVDGVDLVPVVAHIPPFLDALEQFLQVHVVAVIDAQVERAVEWVRATLQAVPVRPLRLEISNVILDAARDVREAGLDAPAAAIHAKVAELAAAVADTDALGEDVRAAVARVRDTLAGVVDTVTTALAAVDAAVRTVTAEAGEALAAAAEAVAAFDAAVQTAVGAVAAVDVDLDLAARQIVDSVAEIRAVVEDVLSDVVLPEPLRPLVDQLVGQLEALNLDADELADVPVFEPVATLLDQFGAGVGDVVRDGLATVRGVVASLVPTELVADIERETGAALRVVSDFEPAALLGDVTGTVTAAIDAVEHVDLTALAAPVRVPYLAILDVWDRLRPSALLEPASLAFADAMAAIALPGAEELVRGVAGTVNTTGDQVGAALAQPLARLGPEGTTAEPVAGAGATAGASPAPPGAGPAEVPAVLPGDVVRLVGFVPGKLREALAAAGAGVLGQVLAGIDAATRGLAADLRVAAYAVARVEASLDAAFDTMFAPVGAAQARAQLAVSARFGTGGAAVTLDLDATFGALAVCGPGSLREDAAGDRDAARDRVRAAAARQSSVATELYEVADALESCAVARLVTDADALLAALDPEPLAREVDALALAVVRRLPEVVGAIAGDVEAAILRVRAILNELSPGAQLGKFVAVLAAVREELSVLDPRVLAAELDEVHAAVRASIQAYDPEILVTELEGLLGTVATRLRALDPAALLGDLAPLESLVSAAAAANPATALAALTHDLAGVVDAFTAIDVEATIEAALALPATLRTDFAEVLQGIRGEIVALLESLRFASGGASASVSVSGGVSL